MTPYELSWLAARRFLPLLPSRVHGDLQRLTGDKGRPRVILDVGGRRSPYTIGVNAAVTVLDLPRTSDVQKQLSLGVDSTAETVLKRWRSNIAAVRLENLLDTELEENQFDGVVSVEVIEHVEADEAFVATIARLIKPGGWFYLTTPNGDYIKNEPPHYNPDHVRHYTKEGLDNLLHQHFARVNTQYAIRTGPNRRAGLRSIHPLRPFQAAGTFRANVLSRFESRGLQASSHRTAHLISTAYKAS